MIKSIVSDVRELIRAGTDYLHTVRKYYEHQNSLSAGEREYGQLNIERIKLHIELDKAELAKRKKILAEEGRQLPTAETVTEMGERISELTANADREILRSGDLQVRLEASRAARARAEAEATKANHHIRHLEDVVLADLRNALDNHISSETKLKDRIQSLEQELARAMGPNAPLF